MSLLGILLAIVAFVIAAALLGGLDYLLRTKWGWGYPSWIIQLGFGLLALVLILYLCNAFGVWNLLRSVRV